MARVRGVVKNAFGHLKARFRRIEKGLDNNIKNASLIIACCCILHHFCITHNCSIDDKWLISVVQQLEREVCINNTNESKLWKNISGVQI